MTANSYAYGYEADLLSFNRNLLANEHEIKCSRADFESELAAAASETQETRRYMVALEARRAGKATMASKAAKTVKHQRLRMAFAHKHEEAKNALGNAGRAINPAPKIPVLNVPNYFYFVCPVGLISHDEVPYYAGLIWFLEGHTHYVNCFEVIRPAPMLHRAPASLSVVLQIARSFEARYWKKYG